jgi:hypothetical protein
MTSERFVIASQVPWESLKKTELEECLYWLVDSMGGKDLEWRIGGAGSGTADQGRDLECKFFMSDPDGNLTSQRWWIEAKGRSETVRPSDVKEAVLNVGGKSEVDVLVIATNTQFSNPTRDWVKEWQSRNPHPKIRLWERSNLEQLCSKHPSVVARLFSDALSIQGKLELVRSKLWNYSSFADKPTLQKLWRHRRTLDWEPESLLAIIASECANGDPSMRSWAALNRIDARSTLVLGLANVPFLTARAEQAGTRQDPFFDALAYLVLAVIHRHGTKGVARSLEEVNSMFDDPAFGPKLTALIFQQVFSTLVAQVSDVCTSDCDRVMMDPITLSKPQVETYWSRLRESHGREKQTQPALIIEQLNKPCKVGFELNRKRRCPITHFQEQYDVVKNPRAAIDMLQDIVRARNPKTKA